jgi:hypothetical protein
MTTPIAGETHTDNGTITIAPGVGSATSGAIELSATLTTLIGGAAAAARPYVTVTNDSILADGTIVAELSLATPAVSLTSLVGIEDQDTCSHSVVLYPNNLGTTTLTLHFNGASAASAVFTGVVN